MTDCDCTYTAADIDTLVNDLQVSWAEVAELKRKLAKAVEAMSNLRQAIRESGVKRTGCMYPAVLSFDAILTELKGDKP